MIDPNNLPQGWTVEPSRFMWTLLKDGERRSFGLTEEIVRNAINLQPEFGGVVIATRDSGSYVDL
jgi:hypothetical protein